MNRRYLALVVVAALAIVGFALSSTPATEAGPATGKGLDVDLTYFDEGHGNLDDFLGTPVVVNFFASWCPPCVAELPDFAQVERELGDQVVFIGINTQEVNSDAARALVEQSGVEYRLATDPDSAIFRGFGAVAMPTTVFITADGTVAEMHQGALFADALEALIDEHLLS